MSNLIERLESYDWDENVAALIENVTTRLRELKAENDTLGQINREQAAIIKKITSHEMSDCTHDYAHRVTDVVANGACPLCLADRIRELEEYCDYLRAENETLREGCQIRECNNLRARVAELEGALRDIVIPSAPLKLDRYTKARALLSSNKD